MDVERRFSRGIMIRAGGAEGGTDAGVISTGSLALDAALGIGGIPRGRITEIYGPDASGKTTLALHIIAEAQKSGGVAAFIDAEHAVDAGYARHVGVDTEALLLSQPDHGEQALEISDLLVHSGALDAIVIDSVAALVPRAELDGEMRQAPMDMQSRLMSQGLRKLTAIIGKSQTSVIFINQLRQKIDARIGHSETTSGGGALTHAAAVRLDLRRVNHLRCGNQVIGSRTRVRVVKNKLAPPFRQVEFDLLYGKGISRLGELLDLGVEHGLVVKNGPWFSYHDTRIGQGRESAKAFLQTSPRTVVALEISLRQHLGLPKRLEKKSEQP